MKITVLYFAALREALKVDRERLDIPDSVRSAAELRQWLCDRGGAWADQLGRDKAVRVAINRSMATAESILVDGAEVAFFPPVTGG